MIQPIRFHAFSRPMVWGGRKLASHLDKKLNNDGPHGESWELSDHPSHLSIIAEGPHKGKTLRDLMLAHKDAILGKHSQKQLAIHHYTSPYILGVLADQYSANTFEYTNQLRCIARNF